MKKLEPQKVGEKYNSKAISIPVINLNEIVTIDDEFAFHIFLGINDKSNLEEAKEKVFKYVKDNNIKGKPKHYYDFSRNTEFKNKRWYVEDCFNVFENTSTKDGLELVNNNDSNYELVLWYSIKK